MIRSVIKKTYLKLTGHDRYFGCSPIHVQLSGQEAADLIRTKILEGSPLMVTRFGGTELSCILNYCFISKNSDFREFVANLGKGIFYGMSWSRDVMNRMSLNAGFFSSTRQNLERYVKMSIEDMRYIDILGSWLKEEQFLFGFMKEHKRVHLEDLFPLNAKNPWSEALRGKRVLVVHPFAETIASQFKKRASLFKDGRVLPDFELMTLKAIQTIAGTRCEFNDWFEALDHMTEIISRMDFDIAILGCGAYGMPLAARIKRMNKQAIHMGGQTQCLFGIKGSRWEDPAQCFS